MAMPSANPTISAERVCFFCVNNHDEIDYKDPQLLRRFLSSYGKIAPRRRSGVCAWHQRKLARAVKRARIAGLVPFVAGQ